MGIANNNLLSPTSLLPCPFLSSLLSPCTPSHLATSPLLSHPSPLLPSLLLAPRAALFTKSTLATIPSSTNDPDEMPSYDGAQERYGLSCPEGSSFYICASSPVRFIGCCDVHPCAAGRHGLGGACPATALRPASYSSYAGPAQRCSAPNHYGSWYTCDDVNPRFMGCCAHNPCDGGCPVTALLPAELSDIPRSAALFLHLLAPNTTALAGPRYTPAAVYSVALAPTMAATTATTAPAIFVASLTSAASVASAAGLPASTGQMATVNPLQRLADPSQSTGLIVGLSMIGVVILLAVIGCILWVEKGGLQMFRRRAPPAILPRSKW
ncbi:hypothetical protein GGS23DRAFT_251879 [Durotheca rogersii]|uniref:uncharacterized protein n=1 Tax=Durotheca rogersii TaxID=419775 RepID=UPI00221FDDC1|nr:uncharacterized protein GGS23DRAFT_251879 [Durotheca rogersii]KAI5860158.1 hypothetical protein GGS23DRAFT_251879 [Durotheca rogersii]